MREYLDIIRRNFLTPVVLTIYSLVAILFILREFRDAWFVGSVITLNTVFGIVQELRARAMLRKLELMSAPRARIVRGEDLVEEVPFTEVQVGDTLQVLVGDEIPADGEIITSRGLEVNESMLTGESVAVAKHVHDTLFASTTAVAGNAIMEVTAVGVETKAGAMVTNLRRYKPELTPLQRNIAKLITILTFVALGSMVVIYVSYLLSGYTPRETFKVITAAGISIIPEGLILASTLLLAYGSLRLAQAKVLPQKLSAIEGMALVETLCTDKTGTLTEDEITFERLEFLTSSQDDTPIRSAVNEFGGGNATSDALIRAFPADINKTKTLDIIPFSSQRKLSIIRFIHQEKTYTVMIGAPEFVSAYAPVSKKLQAQLDELTSVGMRVLACAVFDDHTTALSDLPHGSGKQYALILLNNSLREGIVDAVSFLQDNNITVRVISGDNPSTVQHIAEQAGIKNTQHVITGDELAKLSGKKLAKTLDKTVIFARILPEQKEMLVNHYRSTGQYTAMVGDGVNDALALKASNLGVAMYSGAVATRRVADIVLLNNSFTVLPLGIKLGNRIMQAIELVSTLFFHKVIFGIILLALTLIFEFQYPFEPRHNTFMNVFLVTLPTIMWTLFPPTPIHRVDPRRFWKDTLIAILPIAALTGVTLFVVYVWAMLALDFNRAEASTITALVNVVFGVSAVFVSEKLLLAKQERRTIIARTLYLIAGTLFTLIVFNVSIARQFFDFSELTSQTFMHFQFVPVLLIVVLVIQHSIAHLTAKRLRKTIHSQKSSLN